jgi:hypothetical protein
MELSKMHDNFYRPCGAVPLVGLAPRAAVRPWLTIRKVGGLWHWRIGRLGGSIYFARR